MATVFTFGVGTTTMSNTAAFKIGQAWLQQASATVATAQINDATGVPIIPPLTVPATIGASAQFTPGFPLIVPVPSAAKTVTYAANGPYSAITQTFAGAILGYIVTVAGAGAQLVLSAAH